MSEIDFDPKASPLWMHGADAWQQALKFYNGDFPKAYSTGWPALDEYYKVTPGQLTIVGGIPGHGKSTALDNIAVNLSHAEGWRWAVFSPENYPEGIHAWHLIEKYTGKPMLKGRADSVTQTEMDMAGVWLEEHFAFLTPSESNLTVDGVLACAEAAMADVPFQGMIIDPWNHLGANRTNGLSETDFINLALIKFRLFARKYNVHIFIVVHPKKIERDKDGGYPVPTAWDMAGSAHWRNIADAILTVWRDVTSEQFTAEIHVQKVRFRWVGKVSPEPVQMFYEPLSGTYTAQTDGNAGNWYMAPFKRIKK